MDQKKRVLIITYYWPPSAGSGVQRWLKFAKYLPEFGWEPVIFTPENPDFELKDPSLLKQVDPNIEVLKFPIWEPYQILKFLKKGKIKDPAIIIENKKKSLLDRIAIWVRANLIIPDPRVYWVKPSVNVLLEIMEKNDFKAIITSGPPHSLHLIGRDIKRKKQITWVADFRDPWSTWEFLDMLPLLRVVRKKHERLEASVLKEADAVMTISPTFQKEISQITGRKVHLITNGFDSTDLPVNFTPLESTSDIFEVVYSGIIDAIRDPLPFLNAFKAAFSNTECKVRLTFVGKVSSQVLTYIKEDKWLSEHVELAGYVAHERVFDFYQKAKLLLLILTNTKNAKGNIPGKLFEYIATRRPILALGDPEGDTSAIIKQTGSGKVFLHTSEEEIRQFLITHYEGKYSSQAISNIKCFERRYLTKKLAQLIDEKADSISRIGEPT